MKIILLLVFLAAVMLLPFSQAYHFSSFSASWSDAQKYCRQHYTDLASMDDHRDLQELLRSVQQNYTGHVWTGLHRRDASAPWIWSDYSGSTFMPWAPFQPNNWENNQFCGALSHAGALNDLDCSTNLPFICCCARSLQTARLTLSWAQDVNDPAVSAQILLKIEQVLQERGLTDYEKLSWKSQSDGLVFQKVQKSDGTQ